MSERSFDSSSTNDEILPVTGPGDVLLVLAIVGTVMLLAGGALVLSKMEGNG